MTTEHPITPPPELVQQWYDAIDNSSTSWKQELATQAARWGCQQAVEELETFLKKGNDKR